MPEPLSELKDPDLIRLSLDGDRAAFGSLIGRYQDRLYSSMVHMLRNEADAEDVVQDAFVLAFTKLHSFKGNSQWYTWLYRIAYNVAVNRMRRRKPSVSLSTVSEPNRLDFPDQGPAPGERLEVEESVEQLQLALDRLTLEHRSILVLREIDGLEYETISEILELPIGTVRSRLHRARHQLRDQLEALMHQK